MTPNEPAAGIRRRDQREAAQPVGSDAIGPRGHRIRDLAHAQDRRREIMTGAAHAFARSGYDGASMDDIAREAGLAKGHIYHYFVSKEDIFTEIRVHAIVLALDAMSRIVPAALDDPEHALRLALADLLEGILDGARRFATVLGDPATLSASNRTRIRGLQRRYEDSFVQILRAGIRNRTFRSGDPKLMAFVILRAALSVPQWYRAEGKWKPRWVVAQITDQLVRSVLR